MLPDGSGHVGFVHFVFVPCLSAEMFILVAFKKIIILTVLSVLAFSLCVLLQDFPRLM